jgi:hypothetical protein
VAVYSEHVNEPSVSIKDEFVEYLLRKVCAPCIDVIARLDHSKDMSVHVSTCTSYDFNTLTSASSMEVVALVRRVCFFVSSQK